MGVKFNKEDINSVANARFFRKSGRRYLILLTIAVLAITMLVNFARVIPLYVTEALYAISAIVFVYKYQKKQGQVRKELWDEINNVDSNKTHEIEIGKDK